MSISPEIYLFHDFQILISFSSEKQNKNPAQTKKKNEDRADSKYLIY
jgi:hypothetical protein